MPEVEHEAVEVDLLLAVGVVVVHFTVAADGGSVCPAAGTGRCRATFLDGLHGRLGLFVNIGDFLLGRLLLALEGLDLGLLLLDDFPEFLDGRC